MFINLMKKKKNFGFGNYSKMWLYNNRLLMTLLGVTTNFSKNIATFVENIFYRSNITDYLQKIANKLDTWRGSGTANS